ncbi:MAG TPA: diaminopimelate epimerase [Acidimicrobiales bacterium]|nr:diaminopimelate epimerase [Acidimicrobiales bacterium]
MRLTKHEGWGNDFLVLSDPQNATPGTPELARRLCDRRYGVGADGLLHLSKQNVRADLTMTLHNADGSPAEMSGNGLRCLVQAAVLGGWVGGGRRITVSTAAGYRTADVTKTDDPRVHFIRVDMGAVQIVGIDEDDMLLDVGNPHRVRRVPEPDTYDLAAAGAAHPDVNLEVIADAGRDAVKMRVHERGAGETLACGTGACAVAVAASKWGLVTGTSVTVRQPGGDAEVDITDIDHVQLAGPVTYIAAIETP